MRRFVYNTAYRNLLHCRGIFGTSNAVFAVLLHVSAPLLRDYRGYELYCSITLFPLPNSSLATVINDGIRADKTKVAQTDVII